MSSKTSTPSQEDYLKFKKFLQFFVWQSSKNEDNKKTESPVFTDLKSIEPFRAHYELEPNFHKIAKLEFSITFFMLGHFNSERTTYINIDLFNIIGEFENRKIIALKNTIILDTQTIKLTGDLRKRCAARNEQLKKYSLESLGLTKDCPEGKISEALKSIKDTNSSIQNMLNEFLEIYEEFNDDIRQAIL